MILISKLSPFKLERGGSVSSLVSEKKIFEISANQSILLALAAILNIRLERKTVTL
jgi:hypothetical protein